MSRPRWRKILVVAALVVLALTAIWLWLGWDWDAEPVREKFDQVAIGMRLAEAEAVLGLKPVPKPTWDYYSAPEEIAADTAQTGPWDSEHNFYAKSRYWVILYYNPSTKRIIEKQLRKDPTLLEVFYRRYIRPPIKFAP